MTEAVDSLMELVDGLVSALAEGEFSQPFAVYWKDDPLADLADNELKTTQVWIVDFVENSDTPREIPIDEYELWIVVQKKFGKDEIASDECRKLSKLVSEIRRFCRKTEIMVEDEGTRCANWKRPRSRDFKAYHELGMYRSDAYTTWRKVSSDDD